MVSMCWLKWYEMTREVTVGVSNTGVFPTHYKKAKVLLERDNVHAAFFFLSRREQFKRCERMHDTRCKLTGELASVFFTTVNDLLEYMIRG